MKLEHEFCPRCGSGPRQKDDVEECPDCGYKWAGPPLVMFLEHEHIVIHREDGPKEMFIPNHYVPLNKIVIPTMADGGFGQLVYQWDGTRDANGRRVFR